jgi:hypothetical protein
MRTSRLLIAAASMLVSFPLGVGPSLADMFLNPIPLDVDATVFEGSDVTFFSWSKMPANSPQA